jgi:hypothetical protein
MATSFPISTSYFTGGSHLTEADALALATILNEIAVLSKAAGTPLFSTTSSTATFTPAVNKTYLVDPSAGAFAVTLPTSAVSGDVIRFKSTVDNANLVTINPGAGRTIEGYTCLLYTLTLPTM